MDAANVGAVAGLDVSNFESLTSSSGARCPGEGSIIVVSKSVVSVVGEGAFALSVLAVPVDESVSVLLPWAENSLVGISQEVGSWGISDGSLVSGPGSDASGVLVESPVLVVISWSACLSLEVLHILSDRVGPANALAALFDIEVLVQGSWVVWPLTGAVATSINVLSLDIGLSVEEVGVLLVVPELLALHGDLLAEVLVTVHANSEELLVWKAGHAWNAMLRASSFDSGS